MILFQWQLGLAAVRNQERKTMAFTLVLSYTRGLCVLPPFSIVAWGTRARLAEHLYNQKSPRHGIIPTPSNMLNDL